MPDRKKVNLPGLFKKIAFLASPKKSLTILGNPFTCFLCLRINHIHL